MEIDWQCQEWVGRFFNPLSFDARGIRGTGRVQNQIRHFSHSFKPMGQSFSPHGMERVGLLVRSGRRDE